MIDAKDIDTDDEDDFQLEKEPESSKGWLDMISHAEKEFRSYQDKADSIDKFYANLERMASETRDREFAMFWANIQILAPSIYSRPPVPVVVPKFKDQSKLKRIAAEFLERAVITSFEEENLDDVMREIRDDLVISARGVPWVRYESKSDSDTSYEHVCIEHADRKDFLHDPARKWPDVDWVAKRSWLTKKEMRERFRKTSGDAYKDAAYAIRKDDDGTNDGMQKAGVWEVWSKSQNRVVWVSEGCDKLLDDCDPHLKLKGFFPCPRPAFGTKQRRSLIPVPDFVFYKDQLEEINELTGRISALSEAVRVRALYPAGAGEIGDAIEAALRSVSDNAMFLPISNWQPLGTGGMRDMLVWLPIDMIVSAVTQLVALRKQLIDDVYQITGLSDIMRGATDADETLGAQELKSQYGSVRIKDRRDELTRIALDLTRITAEIMAEDFSKETLVAMAQMDIPTDADIKKQIKPLKEQLDQIEKQAELAHSSTDVQQMAQQNPEQAQQVSQQLQQQAQQISDQIQTLSDTVTIEQVIKLLKDDKLRSFTFDIETDSTIAPDENAQKQRATEYVTTMGQLLAQGIPAIKEFPQAGPLVAATIKFAQQQFRVGRSMDQIVEEFSDAVKAAANQPPPDPNAGAQQVEQQKAQAENDRAASQQRIAEIEAQSKATEAATRDRESQISTAERMQALKERDANNQFDMARKERLADIEAANLQASHANDQLKRDHELAIKQLEAQRIQAEIEHTRAKTAGSVAKDISTLGVPADVETELA